MSSDSVHISALKETWHRVHGTLLLSEVFELLSVSEQNGRLEVQVTAANGSQFGFRVPLPSALDNQAHAIEGAPEAAEHWALWGVIVPLVEELETDAESRYPADDAGIRWIDDLQ